MNINDMHISIYEYIYMLQCIEMNIINAGHIKPLYYSGNAYALRNVHMKA